MDAKPKKCVVTKLGLLALLLAVLCIGGLHIWQRIETGSFARGDGFRAPFLGSLLLTLLPVGLLLALVGSVYDSIRYGRWKKAAGAS